jgi:hypothetical protein
MRTKKAILSGAAAVTLLSGGLIATAGAASAAPNNDPGSDQCPTLIYQLSSDQDELHFWQMQRAQDAGHGVSTGHDDSEIDFYISQIDQDVQALNDEGC